MEYIWYGVTALVVVFILAFILVGYFKAPTDVAYVVSGITKVPRIVIGRASFRLPFFERIDYLDLGLISLDVKTSDSVPTKEYINVNVDSFATVRIKNTPEGLKQACANFLNLNRQGMELTIKQVLEGSLRDIVGDMKLQEMVNNRQLFADKVQESAAVDLERMGIEIVSFNVQNFSDENNVITDMGIDRVVAIQKDAKIAKANAERDVSIAEAKAKKEANDVRMEAEKAIAEKNTEVNIRKAELKQKEDIKRAEANAAYNIQEQVQQKELNIKNVEASIAETEKQVELSAKEAEVKEKELDATVRRQADANRYEAEQKAEAELFAKQKEYDAVQYAALKEAEAIKAKGQAEAEAIKLKGLAEAEALEKKAEAMKKYGDAAKLEMIVNVLPEIAKSVAEPLAQIKNMNVYSGGNGFETVSENVPVVMKQAIDTVKNATGFDLRKVMEAETIDAKVKKDVTIKGAVPVESK